MTATTRTFWRSIARWTGALTLLHVVAILPGRVFGLWHSLGAAEYLGLSALPSVLADLPAVIGFLLPFTALAGGAALVGERTMREPQSSSTWVWRGLLLATATFAIHAYIAPIANWWVWREFYATPPEVFPYGPWTPVSLWSVLRGGDAAGAFDPDGLRLMLHRAFAHPALAFVTVGLGYHLRRFTWRRYGSGSRRSVWVVGLALSAVLMYPYYITGIGTVLSGRAIGLFAWLPLWISVPPLLVFLWIAPTERDGSEDHSP